MLHFKSKIIHSDFSFFFFFMFHFIYFNGLCCLSGVSKVVKRKIFHSVNKVSNYFGISGFNLEMVFQNFIMMSSGPKEPKNKFYQITSTLISVER